MKKSSVAAYRKIVPGNCYYEKSATASSFLPLRVFAVGYSSDSLPIRELEPKLELRYPNGNPGADQTVNHGRAEIYLYSPTIRYEKNDGIAIELKPA